ncbi:MAG: Flp family type IVb pilin [Acidobacteria bacterium]|nr:Flp family type IVb pilin [Acidobacteriota bacterium]
MGRSVTAFMGRTEGQDLAEYGLLAALIALVALGALKTLGTQIDTVFWQVIASSV